MGHQVGRAGVGAALETEGVGLGSGPPSPPSHGRPHRHLSDLTLPGTFLSEPALHLTTQVSAPCPLSRDASPLSLSTTAPPQALSHQPISFRAHFLSEFFLSLSFLTYDLFLQAEHEPREDRDSASGPARFLAVPSEVEAPEPSVQESPSRVSQPCSLIPAVPHSTHSHLSRTHLPTTLSLCLPATLQAQGDPALSLSPAPPCSTPATHTFL